MTNNIKGFSDWLERRRYIKATKQKYIAHTVAFLAWVERGLMFQPENTHTINSDDIRAYADTLSSKSVAIQHLTALNWYFQYCDATPNPVATYRREERQKKQAAVQPLKWYFLEALQANNFASQNELAKAVGASESYISYILSGQRIPSVDLLDKIVDELDISRERVMELAGWVEAEHQSSKRRRLISKSKIHTTKEYKE